MTVLSPALDIELSKDNVTFFMALTMSVGADTVRLLDGSSDLTIGGEKYVGEDPVYGVWADMDSFEDGSGDEAPGLSLTLQPASDEAAGTLSAPSMQGAGVKIILGCVNDATGRVVGDPYVLIDGEIDIPKHEFGKNTLQVSYEATGGMERLFFDDEGLLLVPAFHHQVWPGENGLNHVTGVTDTIYWGTKTVYQ